ncbi:LytR/AlgR family response regulator transcription factor [Clostridium lundense]|uniref:LytR/AlgR family response regulator transcription factor n=1 Tax=Clostridium lundense TaxID=319475 RepID=UPI0004853494|nr:LytTR family DNA-binding domain-containing protein [Clostridium lundense]
MLNIAICDDEIKQRFLLKSTIEVELKAEDKKYNIFQFPSGEKLLDKLYTDKNSLDIIFLDVEMNELNGIETARKIRKLNENVVIIFITGFSDYVFDGYEVKALNYIVKPYKSEKIATVLKDAIKQIYGLEEKYFVVKAEGSLFKVLINDILYFRSDRRKISLVTRYKSYEFYGKISDIEEQFGKQFIRTHQRYLVNLDYITAVKDNFVIVNDENLPISRQRHKDVMMAFAKQLLK